jgi:putative phosphoribosyl transferase
MMPRAAGSAIEADQTAAPRSREDCAMDVSIPAGAVRLEGMLELPPEARGVVAFSHGSGSGRRSPRNRYVAGELNKAGLGTLLLDLLTTDEDRDVERRFDIPLLTARLADAVRFLAEHKATRALPVGLFGASTGAASALRAAAAMQQAVRAVVSRGGRPDLAGAGVLRAVEAPTLLIVGAEDHGVIELNEAAREGLTACASELMLVPRATHLFEEPGTLEAVARLAVEWFARHLASPASPAPRARPR